MLGLASQRGFRYAPVSPVGRPALASPFPEAESVRSSIGGPVRSGMPKEARTHYRHHSTLVWRRAYNSLMEYRLSSMDECRPLSLPEVPGNRGGCVVLGGCRKANPALWETRNAVAEAASALSAGANNCLRSPHCGSLGCFRDGANRALAGQSPQVWATERAKQ